MPCPRYLKYICLVHNAEAETSEALKDLPPLVCNACGKLTHFGGVDVLAENDFTVNDVCFCGEHCHIETSASEG